MCFYYMNPIFQGFFWSAVGTRKGLLFRLGFCVGQLPVPECTFRCASAYRNLFSAWLMGLPIFSELNLSPNFLSENFHRICAGKAYLWGFSCLFVSFSTSPWTGINFLIIFQIFSCHLGQQAMHSFTFPPPILLPYSFQCYSIGQ